MKAPAAIVVGTLLAPILAAQTTQGIVGGRVYDSRTHEPLAATVSYFNVENNESRSAPTDASGYFSFASLSPGSYQMRAVATGYQAQETQELALFVAARVTIEFPLRPLSDVFDAATGNIVAVTDDGLMMPIVGPDLERGMSVAVRPLPTQHGTLFATLSYVINREELENLPLIGRDAYAMLPMLPGVTAENATGRGLGFSVNGQRPSASNYLLDGVENNDYLVTGPLTVAPPESIQEYRISTSNFSAEYGRTSGFVTNAVTRSGAADWHGSAYFYLKNDVLNANTFEHNAGFRQDSQTFGAGLPRTPLREIQSGFQIGGPVRGTRLFHSEGLDFLRSRSFADPVRLTLPSVAQLNNLVPSLPADSAARRLFTHFPPPGLPAGPAGFAVADFSPAVSVDRWFGYGRMDLIPENSGHRLSGRAVIARLTQPDFLWSPYPDFVSPLNVATDAVALGWTSTPRHGILNEVRASWTESHLQWDRAHPEVPILRAGGVELPGSPARYAYRNNSQTVELLDNVTVPIPAHSLKAGGGVLFRRITGHLTLGQDGEFSFNSFASLIRDQPSQFSAGIDRQFPTNQPQYDRRYAYRQYFGYLEDSHRATSRLTLNYGVRYENFGPPSNTGATKDYLLRLGTGGVVPGIRDAALVYPTNGKETLYDSDNNNGAVRFGFAWTPDRSSRVVLRGAYGVFYDRPFDNLWQNIRNNNVQVATADLAFNTDFLAPAASLIKTVRFTAFENPLVTYQPGIRDGYVQSYFLGPQYQAGGWSLELIGSGSAGRKLITNDVVNRAYSLPDGGNSRRINPTLDDFSYRGNQGISNYNALLAVARYRGRGAEFQASYTWSHSIDNQSDPLVGDFFNLTFTRSGTQGSNNATATFSRQFDSRIDRANSDFDQRHNLVFVSWWQVPSALPSSKAAPLFRGWRISELTALRSGFPYTVFAPVNTIPLSGGNLLPQPASRPDRPAARDGKHPGPGRNASAECGRVCRAIGRPPGQYRPE